MFDADQITTQLEGVIFRLEWFDAQGTPRHGTGFFVTNDGLALTAYHNLEAVLNNPNEELLSHYGAMEIRFKWVLPGDVDREWQKRYDLAVLQAQVAVPDLNVQPCVAFDMNLPRRGPLWAGHAVMMVGFAEADKANAKRVHGNISEQVPISDRRRDINGVPMPWVPKALSIVPDHEGSKGVLRGMSGGPVWDKELNAIVGVIFGVKDGVYGTELSHLKEHWVPASQFVKTIEVPQPKLIAPAPSRRYAVWGIAALVALLACLFWLIRTPVPKKLAVEVIRLDKNGRREKVTGNMIVAEGERVRFAIISPVNGHLYVVDREISASGKGQARYLIFPTLRAGNGRNWAKAGTEVVFPGESDYPPYVASQANDDPAYAGEELTVYVLSTALPVNLADDPVLLHGDQLPVPGLVSRLFQQPKESAPLAVEQLRVKVDRATRQPTQSRAGGESRPRP